MEHLKGSVYRDEKWVKIQSEDILPGDICLIQPSTAIKEPEIEEEDDMQILMREIPFAKNLPTKLFAQKDKTKNESKPVLPCDLILVQGGCLVDESILTGESVPQAKDSLSLCTEEADQIDIKKKHKFYTLFCGTEVIQIFDNEPLPPYVRHEPPVRGCIAIAVKTGFETAKGKLTRTVVYNTETATVKQTDAIILILVLLVIALITSIYVLVKGLEEEGRDREKLFLRCILIITMVVPSELPTVMSLGVNRSLMELYKRSTTITASSF